MTVIVEGEAPLRARNQITLPEPVVSALEARPDDRTVFEADVMETGVFRVRMLPTPRTYAGALSDPHGTTEEAKTYLRDGPAAWE